MGVWAMGSHTRPLVDKVSVYLFGQTAGRPLVVAEQHAFGRRTLDLLQLFADAPDAVLPLQACAITNASSLS